MAQAAVETERPQEQQAGKDSQHLDEDERKQAQAHAAPKALVIHEVLREEGETELKRTIGALFWSGLGGGLTMGFSLVTLALLEASLPKTAASGVISSFGYCVGFVIAVLGRQQLFTETTLTATLPFLMRRDGETFLQLMRMWAIVLVSNILGASIFAFVLARPGLFPADVEGAMGAIGVEIASGGFLVTTLRGIFAGWLIALMVWVLPGAGSARLFVIILLTYVVALGHFPHIIAGSVDAGFALFTGRIDFAAYSLSFLLPTLIGNILGGVALAAILNHAPVAHDMAAKD